MGDKKDTKALAGLMEKYSGWKMNRLLASNNVPLRRYLARLGLITAYLVSYPRLKAGASCLVTPPCLPTNPRVGRGGIG